MSTIQGINSIPLSELVKGSYQEGRISVPVKPSQYIYARFKHVVGVPESGGRGGHSLAKLRMLDTLIDGLKKMKGERAYVKDLTGLSSENLDQIVRQYEQEFNRIIKARESSASFKDTGILIDQLG